MEEQFIPYDLALKLKELGFIDDCIAYKGSKQDGFSFCSIIDYDEQGRPIQFFHNNTMKLYDSLPLWQQAFDWFREKYNLSSTQPDYYKEGEIFKYFYHPIYNMISGEELCQESQDYNSFNKCRQACLEKLIEICLEQKEELEQKK